MERQSTSKLFKALIALLALFVLSLSTVLATSCGEDPTVNDEFSKPATCASVGWNVYTQGDEIVRYELIPATGNHTYGADNQCSVCGMPKYFEGLGHDALDQKDLDEIKKVFPDVDSKFDSLEELVEALQTSVEDIEIPQDQDHLHKLSTKAEDKSSFTLGGACGVRGITVEITKCDGCDARFVTNMTAGEVTKHDYQKVEAESFDATCTQQGLIVEQCSVCGDKTSRATQLADHNFGEEKTKAATCQAEGYKYKECSVCGVQQITKTANDDETLAKKQHVFNVDPEDPMNQEATCTSSGITVFACEVCGEKQYISYDMLEHTPAEEKVEIPATCSTPGYTQTVCDVCGAVISSEQNPRDPAKGHNFGFGISENALETDEPRITHKLEPTCKDHGTYVYQCLNCNDAFLSRDIEPDPSKHVLDPETENVVAATCTTDGYTEYTCKVCKETFRDEDSTVKAEGHKWTKWTKPADCTSANAEDRRITLSCETCGTVASEDEHPETEWNKVVDQATAHTWDWENAGLNKMIACGKEAEIVCGCTVCEFNQKTSDRGEFSKLVVEELKTGDAANNYQHGEKFYTVKVDGTELSLDDAQKLLDTALNGVFIWEHTMSAYAVDKDSLVLEGDNLGGYMVSECANCDFVDRKWEKHSYELRLEGEEVDEAGELGSKNYAVATDADKNPDGSWKEYVKYGYKSASCSEDGIIYFVCRDTAHTEEAVGVLPKIIPITLEATGKYGVHNDENLNELIVIAEGSCKTETDRLAFSFCEDCFKNATIEGVALEEGQTLRQYVLDLIEAGTTEDIAKATAICNALEALYTENTTLGFAKDAKEWSELHHFEDDYKETIVCGEATRISGHCSICDKDIDQPSGNVVPAEHEWNAVIASAVDGKATDEYGRTYSYIVSKAATHTSVGRGQWTCDCCGETFNVEIPTTFEHRWSDIIEIEGHEATCNSDGVGYRYCLDCGETISVSIPKTSNHSWLYAFDLYKAPTCEADGELWERCTTCRATRKVGFVPKLGHWYYTISEEEAANHTLADLEENFLNYVKEDGPITSCLTPRLAVVECVHCGVRYNKASAEENKAVGHSFEIVVDATEQVLCGDLKNTKSILHCTVCGYYFDITGQEAKYIENGQLKLVEGEGGETLAHYDLGISTNYLADNEGNLWNYLEPKTATVDAELVNPHANVINAYKGKVQLHKFDTTNRDLKLDLVKGACESEAVYVYVCSICGVDENGKADPKKILDDDLIGAEKDGDGNYKKDADGNIIVNDSYFKAWCEQYYEASGGVDSEEVMKSVGGYESFLPYRSNADFAAAWAQYSEKMTTFLKANCSWFEEGEAEVSNKQIPGLKLYQIFGYMLYTGYNFTAFKVSVDGHDLLTEKGDCFVDPILTFLFEDWAGVTSNDGVILKDNAVKFGPKTNEAFESEETTFGDLLFGPWKNYTDLTEETFKEVYGEEYLNVKMSEYKDVATMLKGMTGAASAWTAAKAAKDGYKGVYDWCQADAETCPLKKAGSGFTGGFFFSIDHTMVYKVAVDKKTNANLYYEEVEGTPYFFTLGDDSVDYAAISSEDEAAEVSKTLRFLQWLIENPTTAQNNINTKPYYEKYSAEGKNILDSSVLSNGKITCIVLRACRNNCGYEPKNGGHQMNYDDPVYGANCQRGPRCVACGEILGQPSKNHNLANVVSESFQSDAKLVAAWNALLADAKCPADLKNIKLAAEHSDPTCWTAGGDTAYKTVTICVGCLEAWYEDSQNTGVDGYEKKWSTGSWTKDTNYTVGDVAQVPGTTENHSYELNETNVENIVLFNKNVEAFAKFIETVDGVTKIKEDADKTEMIAAVKAELEKIASYKVSGSKATDTITVSLDDDTNKLVLTSKSASNDSICVGGEYTVNLCIACAIHFNGDTTQTGFGTDGKVETVMAQRHVYAPKKDADPTKNDKDEWMVEAVCLRCKRFDDENSVNDKLINWRKGDADESFDFVATSAELTADTSITDRMALAEAFTTKAQDLTISASYVTESTKAQQAMTDVAAKGGVVEIAKGVEATFNTSFAVNEDTEIVLGEGAKVTVDGEIAAQSGKTLKIKGGEVVLNSTNEAVRSRSGGTLELEGVKIDASKQNYSSGTSVFEDSKFVAKDSVIIANSIGFMTNNVQSNPATVEMTNTTVIGIDDVGIVVNADGDFTFTGCSFWGKAVGAWVRGTGSETGSHVVFDKCNFYSGGEKESWQTNQWAQGSQHPDDCIAALLIGNGTAAYNNVTDLKVNNCTFGYAELDDSKNIVPKTEVPESKKFNPVAIATYENKEINVTFDEATWNALKTGDSEYSFKTDAKTLYLEGSADGSKITFKVGTRTIEIKNS